MKVVSLIVFDFLLFLTCHSQTPNLQGIDSAFEKELSEKDLIGKPFPIFKITNENKEWTNQSLVGKTVYINFWFAACSPCMAEMPQINDLYKKFKEDTNFVLLSFTFDDLTKINSIRANQKIEYDIFQVSREECRRLNRTYSYPANVVVDNKGIIRFYDTGGLGIGWLTTRHFKKKIYPAIENSLSGR